MICPTPAQIWDRKEWSQPFTFCWSCGYDFTKWQPDINDRRWREIHEIERKGQTTNWKHRCNNFITCNVCHADKLASSGPDSHAMQLALKWIFDREHYDRRAWHALRGRPDTYATVHDIAKWVIRHRATGSRIIVWNCN